MRRRPRAQIYKGDWQGIIPLPLVNDDDPNTPRLAHWSYLIICVFKLIGIAWSMAFRFRGGVIYPLIYAGALRSRIQAPAMRCGAHAARCGRPPPLAIGAQAPPLAARWVTCRCSRPCP